MSQQHRERFEQFIRSSRTSKGREGAEKLLTRMDGGDYLTDHTQRHWWTWQSALGLTRHSQDAQLAAAGQGQALRDALEAAKNGLQWYRDTYPEADSGADDEMMAQIEAALASPAPTEAAPVAPVGLSGKDIADSIDPLTRTKPVDNLILAVAAKYIRALAASPATAPQASEKPIDDKAHPRFIAGYMAGLHDRDLKREAPTS